MDHEPDPVDRPPRDDDLAALDEKLALAALDASPVFPERNLQKEKDILEACRWRDLARLRELADSEGGFLTDALRRDAWPILLGLPPLSNLSANDQDVKPNGHLKHDEKPVADAPADTGEWKQLPRHKDEDQVQLDVNRSFVNYPSNLSETQLEQRRSELSSLIVEVLRRNPYLCYFQGFHDICQVFLLVLSPPQRAPIVSRLSILRIRDFMLPTISPTTAQLRLLPDILARGDPKLHAHLAGIEPFYALSGTLTMYSHDIERYLDIARLFDVFLAREPVFSIFMFAQIVIDRRDEIFELDEPDMLQVILGRLPKLDIDGLVARSVLLFDSCPPEKLRAWRTISSASALKTARNTEECAKQTLEQGHEYFEKQAEELRRAHMWDKVIKTVRDRPLKVLWRYRRSVRRIGMAFAFGAFAFYLHRNPSHIHRIFALFSRQ